MKLVQCLAGQVPSPAGFAHDRLQATAWALVRKRARAVARVWPGLTKALGPAFTERFTAFAASTPLPQHGGALADGRAFAAALGRQGLLPDAGRMEAHLVDLHYKRLPHGLMPRRGPAMRMVRLRNSRRICIGVRLPWWGVGQLFLPWR